MPDLIIRNGDVVDGTGAPRRRADVAVEAGRVTAVGDLAGENADRVIDAEGRVVAPGFLDVHTHYDAQAFWDPTLDPSARHGVTSVIGGNCGFSIAPLGTDPADGAYLMRMLARVEGIPLATLEAGVPFDWRSTADYLDRLDGTLAVNTAFKVGHSALRRVVMGEEATRRTATPDEVAAMARLLRQGLDAGAVGFSSSWSRTHNDGDGVPVPSRHADAAELLALCRVCRDVPGTSLEFIPDVAGEFDGAAVDLMAAMSRTAERPLNWNVLPVTAGTLPSVEAKLAAGTYAAANGGKVIALTVPMTVASRLSFSSGFLLDAMPGWEDVLFLPHDERRRALDDPEVRRRLRAGAGSSDNPVPHVADWAAKELLAVHDPALTHLTGRIIGDLAAEEGIDPFDALLDVVVADDLRTSFGSHVVETREDWEARAAVWRDPRSVVGASDAGAHLDLFASAHYPSVLLAQAVREHEVITLEEGIRLLTGAPADLYGFVDRGRLRPGAWADIVVLDPVTVGSGPVHTRHDLPGGAGRLRADAIGIDAVLVAGTEVMSNGEPTGARPGRVLRSGVATRTPTLT